MSDVLDTIRASQLGLEAFGSNEPPVHAPEMLLIGCVDARKDPIGDLGIPKGKAIILRNVAALVHPEEEGRLTESAALAFAVREMKVKHVAIMGHTDCGGIRAAIQGISSYSLRDYLAPINQIKDTVCQLAGQLPEQTRMLEQESVKYSYKSLLTYDYIMEAVEAGRLQLHGWVMDTASGKILAYNPDTDNFLPL